MTDMQDRIKELAIEAGMGFNQRIDEFSTPFCDGVHVEQLTRFAQAIARECADISFGTLEDDRGEECGSIYGERSAHAIRARFGLATHPGDNIKRD